MGFAADPSRQTYGEWKFGWIDGLQAWMAKIGAEPYPGAGAALQDITLSASRAGADPVVNLNVALIGDVLYYINGGSSAVLFKWLFAPPAANYEVRMDSVSGNPTSGAMGVYLPMSQDRVWALTRSIVGTQTCVLTLSIRKIGQTTPIQTCTVTLTVTKS